MNIQSVKQRFGIIGRSPLLDRALDTAMRVAGTDLTVLIQGQSGVGKEVFSRIIHELSIRKHENFIAVNCGAIPAGTINSELFGHEKGAFTGATADRKGYFETVNKGTIFLDEIGEMPLDTQAYLLRILENGEFLRVGSSKVLKTDVRIIAATNVDLRDSIKKGKFREDLFYRLNTVPIYVPSLQERREDIYMLWRKFAVDFAEKYGAQTIRLDDHARLLIENYAWPGNIRELKNMVEQLSVLADDKEISGEELVELVPHIRKRNLPANTSNGSHQEGAQSFQERELLFKFLLDMKADLNDLKGQVYQLVRDNNLTVSDIATLRRSAYESSGTPTSMQDFEATIARGGSYSDVEIAYDRPLVIDKSEKDDFDHTEEIEESLSLQDMEHQMIKKALIKYKGRRKEAADELGISERTLYRKIKEYDIQE